MRISQAAQNMSAIFAYIEQLSHIDEVKHIIKRYKTELMIRQKNQYMMGTKDKGVMDTYLRNQVHSLNMLLQNEM